MAHPFADVLPFRIDMAGDDGADYSLRYDNVMRAVQVYDDRTGVLLDQRLAQEIEYIRVVGTTADDKLTIDNGDDISGALRHPVRRRRGCEPAGIDRRHL